MTCAAKASFEPGVLEKRRKTNGENTGRPTTRKYSDFNFSGKEFRTGNFITASGLFFYRVCPERPNELRMFERSRFSRRFISVRKVLNIRAFRSSVRCRPLVATRAR